MNEFWRNYLYVDAYYEHPTTKKPMKWQRIQVDNLERALIKPAGGHNCFASAQRFKDSTSLKQQAQEAEKKAKKNGHDPGEAERLRREAEAVELPSRQLHYLGPFFDFDCVPGKRVKWQHLTRETALDLARKEAVTLCEFFLTTFDLNPAHVQVWFSGAKGFHVMVRPEPFSIRPHPHLTYIMNKVAVELEGALTLETLDLSVYTVPRVWRIPNTTHEKTRKYKIELTVGELKNLAIDTILEMASAPRRPELGFTTTSHIWEEDEYDNTAPSEVATDWMQDFVDIYEAYHDALSVKPRLPIHRPEGSDQYPDCIRDLLGSGPKEGGPNRNKVLLPIVSFLKDAGLDRRDAQSEIDTFTKAHYGSPPSELKTRLVNAKSVVGWAYRGGSSFSCRVVRALKGSGPQGRVACCGEEACPWISDPKDQEPLTVPILHLSEATNGIYVNTRVKTPVHVAAMAARPYGLPIKGKVVCNPDPEAKICSHCPNLEAGGKLEFTFDSSHKTVLELINVTEFHRKGAIKRHVGIPTKCMKHDIELSDRSNLEEMSVVPMVDYHRVYEIELPDETLEEARKEDPAKKKDRHSVQQAFNLGHGLTANKKYLMEGYVFEHPKDQKICFVADKFEPSQSDIDQFQMTPELYLQLLTFQTGENQSVDAKLREIHADLEANVTHIGGRYDLSLAIDLCYHSVLSFFFIGDLIHKGWFELLVVGDTSCGKAVCVDTELPTPRGMRKAGVLSVGDEVFGSDGKPTRIVGVYPQGERPLYRVTFRDGVSVLVDGAHLWNVGNINWERDGHAWKTKTTQELLDLGLHWKGVKNSRAKYWIPTIAPIELPWRELPLHPYALGVLLGDGSLSKTPTISNPEVDVMAKLRAHLPVGDDLRSIKTSNPRCPRYSVVGQYTATILQKFGLQDSLAATKAIPDIYLWASIDQRLALLRGLLDTDGHVDSRGKTIDFVTVSSQLAEGVTFLVQSLGGLVNRQKKETHYTKDGARHPCQDAYRLGIHFANGVVPVSSVKHLARWEVKEERYHRTIESIEPAGTGRAVCFKVAADDKLFAVSDFIVTHNTHMVKKLMQHYGLGELVGGEGANRTGLTHGNVQMASGQWAVQWGRIPQNDGRLLVIDEMSGISPEQMAELTQIRSEGIARGHGMTDAAETWARTRLIFLTNPRDNRGSLSGFNYGIEAVRDLFKHDADVRRVDLAITVASKEVERSMLNRRWDRDDYNHVYTADLCKQLVLWTWSRSEHDVKWQPKSEDRVLEYADRLGATYECDIHLATSSDLKLKIARVAAAVAASVFSTDSNAKKLLVTTEHVEVAAETFDRFYRKPSMAYFDYAHIYKETNAFTQERKQAVYRTLESFDDAIDIVKTLLEVSLITKPTLSDMLGLGKEEFTRLWKWLVHERFLVKEVRGFKKAHAFTELLREVRGGDELGHKEDKKKPPTPTSSSSGSNGTSSRPDTTGDIDIDTSDAEEPPF